MEREPKNEISPERQKYFETVDEILELSKKVEDLRASFENLYMQSVYEFKTIPSDLTKEQRDALESESTEFREGRQKMAAELRQLSADLSAKVEQLKEMGGSM